MTFVGSGEIRSTPAPTHRYFWANGHISANHDFNAGAATITVRAAGQLAGGVGPHIVVTVGGIQIGETTLNTTAYSSSVFNFTAGAGPQEIRVTYDNDTIISGQDRNLLVDFVQVDEPDDPVCIEHTEEAENMTFVGNGQIMTGPPAHRYYWTNGHISTTYTFVDTPMTLRVTARGEPAGGIWPHIVVTVDGAAIGDRSVNSSSWVEYSFSYDATAGAKEVRVVFDNDGVSGTEDRNLRVDKVEFLCGGFQVEPGSRSELMPEDWYPGYSVQGRFLQDYSYAGYEYGEEPPTGTMGKTIYNVPAGANVATVNSLIDTANANGGGIILFPSGTFTMTGNLNVIRSGVILRGAGPSSTFVRFTNLSSADDQHSIRFMPSSYAETTPTPADKQDVMEERGVFDDSVLLRDASSLAIGDEIIIGWKITTAFKNEHFPSTTVWWGFVADGTWKGFFRRKITNISGNRVYLDVPIRYAIKLRDTPSVKKVTGYVTDCAIESMSLSNATTWANAWAYNQNSLIRMDRARSCWVRNIHTYAGNTSFPNHHVRSHGIMITNSRLVTVLDTTLEGAQNRGNNGNGYLYDVERSNEILIRDSIAKRGRHNFTVNWDFGASGLVFLRVHSEGSRGFNSSTDDPVTGGWAEYSDFHHALSMGSLVDSSTIEDGWMCWNRRDYSTGAGMTCTQTTFWNNSGNGRIWSWQYGVGYVIGTRDLEVITTLAQDPGNNSIRYEGTAPDDYSDYTDMPVTETLSPSSLYEEQRQRRLTGN